MMKKTITNYDCFPAMCKDYERELSEWLKVRLNDENVIFHKEDL